MRPPDPAGHDNIPHPPKVWMETAVEPHHQPNSVLLDCLEGAIDRRQVQSDRFLTEDVLAGLCRLDDVIGMGVCTGSDGHRVDIVACQNLSIVRGHRWDAALLRAPL